MSSLFPRLLFALSLSPLLRGAAFAAAAVPPDQPVQLDPLVTTVARGDTPLRLALDPKASAQPAPAHDGADVLKNIPGFAVIRKGGTDGDPVFRGLAGSRLGVQIDGECIFGGCGNRMDPPTAYIFPAAYDRITIIKGPQTVLHGPGNSAGLILFERDTRRPVTPQASLFASTTAGSFGRLDAALDARAAVPSAQARFSATTTRADDYTDGTGRRVHSAYERWSAHATAAWTPDSHTTIEYSTAWSDGEAAYADRAMDGVKFARDNHGLRFSRTQLTPLVTAVEARAYRNYVDHVMDNYSLRTFAATAMMPGRSVSNPDRLTTGGLAQVVLAPAAPAQLTLGLDTQRNTHSVRSTANEAADPFGVKARARDAEFRQAGMFAEHRQTLSAASRVFAGARLDRWRATDRRAAVALSMVGTAPNPGAQHERRSDLASGFARYEHDLGAGGATLFAGLGRLQRFPDYWELIKNESQASVSAFGTRPETTTQWDAGVLYRRGPVQASVSAFAASLHDFALVQSNFAKTAMTMGGMGGLPTTTTRLATVTRSVDATTWGGEADLGWRFAEHWRLDASLAYVRGKNDTDARPLAQLPPLEGRLGLSFTEARWSVGALLRGVAAQNRFALNQGNIVGQDLGRTAGFGTLALHASCRASPWARVSAGVDNLLDRAYAEHLSRSGAMVPGFVQTARVTEPGRFLWLKCDVSL
ncbi:MAG: TonB-dependent copper receptor [Verrucomicrobia bacterium]|nr:TonB-dependent copper receptor [Verrucomicrobiota bacterium]